MKARSCRLRIRTAPDARRGAADQNGPPPGAARSAQDTPPPSSPRSVRHRRRADRPRRNSCLHSNVEVFAVLGQHLRDDENASTSPQSRSLGRLKIGERSIKALQARDGDCASALRYGGQRVFEVKAKLASERT